MSRRQSSGKLRQRNEQQPNPADFQCAGPPSSSKKYLSALEQRARRKGRFVPFITRLIFAVVIVNFLLKWKSNNYFSSVRGSYLFEAKPYFYNALDQRTGSFPRIIQYSVGEEETEELKVLDPNAKEYEHNPRELELPRWQVIARKRLDDTETSKDYEFRRADPFETEDCKAQYDWQLASYQTCNMMHELDLTDMYFVHPRADDPNYTGAKFASRLKRISNGYWRDVWTLQEHKFGAAEYDSKRQLRKIVMKTMRYQHDFVERNYDRHRRDALVSEHLKKSKYVVDIYSFCGNSGLFEYGSGGDIVNAIWSAEHNLTRTEKLVIGKLDNSICILHVVYCSHNIILWAVNHLFRVSILIIILTASQAASGLADLHNIDKEGQASIAHTDISPSQYIKIDGIYKLNDFNRARLIRWNVQKDEPCGYSVAKNPGRNRSPEEYLYQMQTEKVRHYRCAMMV